MLPVTPIKLLPGDRVMRFKEVVALLGLCKPSVYALINTGEFPRQFKLSQHGRASGWLASEVLAYLTARTATRTAMLPIKPALINRTIDKN